MQLLKIHFHKLQTKAGFTLIEVLIAVVIVGTVLTAIATTMTGTVKNSAESRYRSRATVLAQSAMEFFAREKQLVGWGDFNGFFPNGTTTYCLVDLPDTTPLSSLLVGTCNNAQVINEPGVSFKRQAVMTKDPTKPGQIQAVINVSWVDGAITPTVTLERVFQQTD